MTNFEITTLSLQALQLLVVAGGVFYAAHKLNAMRRANDLVAKVHSADHDWNKRLAAKNALVSRAQTNNLFMLNKEFDYLNCKHSLRIDEILTAFERNESLQLELHKLLNGYERMANGILQGVYDEEVVLKSVGSNMIKAVTAFKSYIEHRRTVASSPRAWIEAEAIAHKWQSERRPIEQRPDSVVAEIRRTL